MFKGTSKIATLDWENEKIYLDQITELFELHKATDDPAEKLAIYEKIDSVSQIAASYVVPNEYDKMVSSLGAKRTNAGTSYESTVYINDIPSNEFEKWLKLESERFSNMVLRLFHTELETVYEEFNMYQDMDRSRVNKALMQGLFKEHPYGKDVIGTPEDLKNPSIKNIYAFAETWYRPNNIAIAIVFWQTDIMLVAINHGPPLSSVIMPTWQLAVVFCTSVIVRVEANRDIVSA
jgi:zinc protease